MLPWLFAGLAALPIMALSQAAETGDAITAGRLKADQVCANCHGLHGELASGGNSAMSPKLTAQSEAYLASRLMDYRSGKIEHPQMTLIARMISEQDIDNVSAWYANVSIEILGNADEDGKQEASRFCAGCHGLDGQAITTAGAEAIPNLTAQPRDYLVFRLRDYRSGRLSHPLMTPIAKQLTDQDIDRVAAWYSGIEVNILESN